MPEKDKFVIWPIYFDAARSRDEGRMVSQREVAPNWDKDSLRTPDKTAVYA